MLKPIFFLGPLLVVAAVFLTGAWSRPAPPPSPAADKDFVPQALALQCDTLQGKISAKQLLEKAVENLSGPRAAWLRTKIRQRVQDAEKSFTAEGFLQRGPNQCARLEMQVQTPQAAGRLRVISDGELLVQEHTIADLAPETKCEELPAKSEPLTTAGPAERAREAYLTSKCCGGPLALLQPLAQHLDHLKLQTGLLGGQSVVRLKGDWGGEKVPGLARTAIPLQFCQVYLDAKTLWPHRIEWWGAERAQPPRCVVRIDFHDFALNQELSVEECVRLFSYE